MKRRVKFIDNRFFAVDGIHEGTFEPSGQGVYVSLFVMQDDGNMDTKSIARFCKYGGNARGLAEAKRWLKAAFRVYATGTELYAALQATNPETDMKFTPHGLIPVPPPAKRAPRVRRVERPRYPVRFNNMHKRFAI